jgi:hypothetical protein
VELPPGFRISTRFGGRGAVGYRELEEDDIYLDEEESEAEDESGTVWACPCSILPDTWCNIRTVPYIDIMGGSRSTPVMSEHSL